MRRVKSKSYWMAKQQKRGWRLGFCFGQRGCRTHWLNIWFASAPDVAKALKGKCIYLHRRSVDGPKELDL